MGTNIFGEQEHEPVYEMLYCPAGCEYTRFGSRDLERFRCHTCKKDMVNEAELDIIEQQEPSL